MVDADPITGLAAFFTRLRDLGVSEPIDVEIEWPPEEDGVHLVAVTGWLVFARRPNVLGRHFLDSAAWGGDPDVDDTRVFEVLRQAWQRSALASGGPELYLRLHDSASSVAARTGEELWDRHRPDRVVPPRKAIAHFEGRPPLESVEGDEVRRGATIGSYAALAGAAPSASPEEIRTKLEALGIRIFPEHGTDLVGHLVYLTPYPRKVCGVWIGASASEVLGVLGDSEDESIDASGRRAWTYDRGGHLYIRFNANDLVELIIR